MHRLPSPLSPLSLLGHSSYNAISFSVYGGGCKFCTFGDGRDSINRLYYCGSLAALPPSSSVTRSVLRSSLHSTASCIIRLLLRSGAYLDSKSLSGRNNLFAAILIRAVFTPPIWLGNLSHLARRLARSPARAVKPNYLSLSLFLSPS